MYDNDWYDKGEGSEHMKRQIAQDTLKYPVPHPMCIGCDYKKRRNRKRVGIIVQDCMGGDASYRVVSAKDYKIVCDFNPTKIWKEGTDRERLVLDTDKFQSMVFEYFFDKEKEEDNEKVLERWSTQTLVPEKIDLFKYNIIGMLALPGG